MSFYLKGVPAQLTDKQKSAISACGFRWCTKDSRFESRSCRDQDLIKAFLGPQCEVVKYGH